MGLRGSVAMFFVMICAALSLWEMTPVFGAEEAVEEIDPSNPFALVTEDSLTESGWFCDTFQRPLLIRGQAADSSGYWQTVQQQTPYFLAQSDPASVAPSLGTPTTPSPTATSANPVAPPMADVNVSTLNPSPAAPASDGDTFFTEPVGTMKRFWDCFSLNYTYVPRGGKSKGLGINEFDLAGRFALPCRLLPHVNDTAATGYWFIAPNFSLQLWDGPESAKIPGDMSAMPGSTFEAALAAGMKPQFTKDFGVDLWFQVGAAASFKKVTSKAIFFRGRALGTLRINEQIQAVGGVIYYDRNRWKLLPSGGIEWRPNSDNVWYLVFPNPRLSRFLKKINETDWWGYIQGDIGGGRWLVKQYGQTYNVDYNDYRIGVGLTFLTPSSITGSLEVGGAFARQTYAFGRELCSPKSMVYLKGGIAY